MGDREKLIVRSIQFSGDGSVAFDYMAEADQRDNGMMMSRALYVPPPEVVEDPVMADDLDDLERTAERVLRKALEQHETARGIEDDSGPGPYDNPEER